MSAVTVPVPVPPPRITPDEMLPLPDDGRLYELVDGQLREKRDLAQFVANHLKGILDAWSARTGVGTALVESTFRCFPHAPELVRRADVAFISADRPSTYQWGQRHFTIAPDLAVEVVSPNDNVYELDRRIRDHFRAGVRRVWVINPDQETVRIHRGPGDLVELVGDAEVVDDVVLPGFRCRLPQIFAKPKQTTP